MKLCEAKSIYGWSHWLCGLRLRSVAAHLLRLWVWIPSGAWMCVCCQVEVSVTGRSLIRRSPANCVTLSCVI